MENASNALFIAAGVLITVLVLSLGMYLFASFNAQAREVSQGLAEQELERFNVQFTSLVGQEGVTIYNVVSIANIATENNIYYELPRPTAITGNDNYVTVEIKNDKIGYNTFTSIEKAYNESNSKTNIDNYNAIIEKSIKQDCKDDGTLSQYDCTVKLSKVTGRVYLVQFSKK